MLRVTIKTSPDKLYKALTAATEFSEVTGAPAEIAADEGGRQIWQDTIKDVKLSLMKTGVFNMSKAQERLMKLRATGTINAGNDLDDELEFIEDKESFDPYNSTKK